MELYRRCIIHKQLLMTPFEINFYFKRNFVEKYNVYNNIIFIIDKEMTIYDNDSIPTENLFLADDDNTKVIRIFNEYYKFNTVSYYDNNINDWFIDVAYEDNNQLWYNNYLIYYRKIIKYLFNIYNYTIKYYIGLYGNNIDKIHVYKNDNIIYKFYFDDTIVLYMKKYNSLCKIKKGLYLYNQLKDCSCGPYLIKKYNNYSYYYYTVYNIYNIYYYNIITKYYPILNKLIIYYNNNICINYFDKYIFKYYFINYKINIKFMYNINLQNKPNIIYLYNCYFKVLSFFLI